MVESIERSKSGLQLTRGETKTMLNVEPQGKEPEVNEGTDKGYRCGGCLLLMRHK